MLQSRAILLSGSSISILEDLMRYSEEGGKVQWTRKPGMTPRGPVLAGQASGLHNVLFTEHVFSRYGVAENTVTKKNAAFVCFITTKRDSTSNA